MPAERHRDRCGSCGLLWSKKQPPGRLVEQNGPITQLIPKERAETPCGSDKPAKRWPIQIVTPDFQPPPAVVANKIAIDEKTFDQIDQRVLLEIAGRVARRLRN